MKSLRKEHKDFKILPIIAIIEIIERENRFFIWRFFEYLFSLFNYVLYKLLGQPLINYSIGRYQIKIEYILEYKKIEYVKQSKKLFLLKNLRFHNFIEIITCSNKLTCIESTLKSKFTDYDWANLTEENLKNLALFYSRNIEFIDNFNYFTIMKELYYLYK
jgi:hypothetical protein